VDAVDTFTNVLMKACGNMTVFNKCFKGEIPEYCVFVLSNGKIKQNKKIILFIFINER